MLKLGDGVRMLEDVAVDEYLARQRRDRHPKGKFDSAGRWYPSNSEVRDCCERIRSPSRRWPYSLMLHCRTAKHVAALFNVSERTLRTAFCGRHRERGVLNQ